MKFLEVLSVHSPPAHPRWRAAVAHATLPRPRHTIRRRSAWSAAASCPVRARSRSRTTACFFSTNCRNSTAPGARSAAPAARGRARHHRARAGTITLPCSFQLVAAMNPCPAAISATPSRPVAVHPYKCQRLSRAHLTDHCSTVSTCTSTCRRLAGRSRVAAAGRRFGRCFSPRRRCARRAARAPGRARPQGQAFGRRGRPVGRFAR